MKGRPGPSDDRSILVDPVEGWEPFTTPEEAFCRAVVHVVERFDVRLVVGLGAIPMAVPHTRPTMLTQHATRPELLVRENVWKNQIRVPGSAQAVLELRLGEAGHDACGWVAHVPHYVAQMDYPLAAAALLAATADLTGLAWDLEPLLVAGEERAAEVARQVEDSAEVREVVEGLEQQYDAFHRSAEEGSNLLAEPSELPSGEELGAQFEQFLAGLDGDDRED